jgi:hypothetical protein
MSETVNALRLALRKGPPQMACCTRCDEPLICTVAFAHYEFYCLCCGKHLGFVEPTPRPETPENAARYDELKAEWDAHTEGIVPEGQFGLTSCEKCNGSLTHRGHMTQAEFDADTRARAWLKERASA